MAKATITAKANTGAGTETLVTDTIAADIYPVTKVVLGAYGADDDPVSTANPMPVSDAGGSLTVDGTVAVSGTVAVTDNGGSLTVDGTVAATQSGTWDVGTVTTVTSITNAVAVTDNSGSLTVDDGGTTLSIDDGAGSITVDGSVSLAAELPAGTNNIGDVDVLTVPAPLSTTGGGTEATALRVTLANDSTGVVSVDDNGGSLTVDGSVSVTHATQTSGGQSVYNIRSAASTNATNVKASAGTVYGWFFQNNATVQQFVRLYNLSSAPTPNSSTVFIGSIVLNPGDSIGQDYGPHGVAFGTGIGFCITSGQSATDNGSATADAVLGHIRYA